MDTRFKKGQTPWNKNKGKPKEGNKTCDFCGKQFHYVRSHYNDPPKCCSQNCRYKLTSKTGTHHIVRVCTICKREFHRPPSIFYGHIKEGRINDGTYCSRKCRWANRGIFNEKQKCQARNAITRAILTEKIIRQPCLACGEVKTEAHHHRGYAKENWFDIIWLCDFHHNQEHERLRRISFVDS
jgi:hypothetical protein